MTSNEPRANASPLTPISFLVRGAQFLGERPALIYGEQRFTYEELLARVQRLAAALAKAGIGAGDHVGVLAPNIPPMVEAHFGVPMIGAVITPLNPGLDAATIGAALAHCKVRLLLCDHEFLDPARQALDEAGHDVPIVVIHDAETGISPEPGMTDYEAFLDDARADTVELALVDEWQPISLLYTSGTTGIPKGVVHIHRGAYLASLSNALSFGLNPASVHLWTWPMFHCNGLCFIWAVAAVGGTQVCMRRIDASRVFDLIRRHRVTHFCAPPSVVNLLASDPMADDISFDHGINCITGGAAPPSFVIQRMERLGIEVTHQYGCTEGFGPLTMLQREEKSEQLPPQERSARLARQGTPTAALADLMVAAPGSTTAVPRDGSTLGEVLLRGNTLMDSYFSDPEATNAAMSGGWFRSGDIAVWHSDGCIEVKDRATDMIVSGGKRISSVEIEEVLYRHPDVLEAAVVAVPDDVLGEVCCAFVSLVPGRAANDEALTTFCRANMETSKVPTRFIFRDLPKTGTGKIKKDELRRRAREPDRVQLS